MEAYSIALKEYKKSDGKNLSQKSQSTYLRNLKKLTDENGWDFTLKNIKPFLSQFTQTHQVNYLNAIMNYLTIMKYDDAIIGIYRDYR